MSVRLGGQSRSHCTHPPLSAETGCGSGDVLMLPEFSESTHTNGLVDTAHASQTTHSMHKQHGEMLAHASHTHTGDWVQTADIFKLRRHFKQSFVHWTDKLWPSHWQTIQACHRCGTQHFVRKLFACHRSVDLF